MLAFDSGVRIADGVHQFKELCRRFSLSEIQSATNDFDEALVIGKGGFGKVYKGFIDDGATTVAIKRLEAKSKQGAKEFWTEIKTLSKFRHTYLLSLIGYSDDCKEMILVYEYIVNGTLADHLYKNGRKGIGNHIYHLTWEQRLNICIGAAHGLNYLHTEQSVIHRDVKSTNILLDQNWIAKISDFGLSRMGVTNQSQTHISTDVKGTFGYLDPQYFLTRRLTKKSDVYAFGVVMFEVLCARPAVDFRVEEEQCSLALWAQQCIKKGILDQIIDPSLEGQIKTHCLKMFAEIANKCLHNHPRGRPTMAEVAESLELVLASQGSIVQHKGITKVFMSTARVAAKGIALGRRKWKDCSTMNALSSWLHMNLFAGSATQLHCRFSLAEIRAATNNFHKDTVIWHGGDAKGYRGHINHGNLEVAIKRSKEGTSIKRNMDQFMAQIKVLSTVQHLHIVSLIGYCNDKHELIQVYEYMIHGTLYHHLYETNNGPIPWEKRIEICIGVARGLQYLHVGAKQTIIHCNLKPANILFDKNWVAKVVLPHNVSSIDFTTFVAGTVGYMDPEYIASARLTEKSDVYSFGVILLELLCGRKPMIFSLNEDEVNLVRWFKTNIRMGTVDQIVDPYLIGKIGPECLKEYVLIAENCVRDKGIERPLMDDVLGGLRCTLQLQETWQNAKFHEADPDRGLTDGMSFKSIEDSDYFSDIMKSMTEKN